MLPPLIDSSRAVEEEQLPFYEHQQYYPVHIGEVFNSSGGTYSALKISTQLQNFPKKRRVELAVYKHLSNIESTHPGQSYILELYDEFEVSGPHDCHQCLVQPAMHLSIFDMMKLNPEPLNVLLLKGTLGRLLTALDFLHTDAQMVHTDLKADNLMLVIEDHSILEEFEKAELADPSPRKVIDDTRTIYTSRNFNKLKNGLWGYPVLCDFGEAKKGVTQITGPFVQPHIYTAPEVTFQMPWGPPAEIWNVATLIWDLFEGRHLFNHIMDENNNYDPFKHMAQISALIGLPTADFMPRSETTSQCFDANGRWVAEEYESIPNTSLEDQVTRLEGQEKLAFLRFIRHMLEWLPEKRKTARQLLDDPWLQEE